jgi:hypothetical protein
MKKLLLFFLYFAIIFFTFYFSLEGNLLGGDSFIPVLPNNLIDSWFSIYIDQINLGNSSATSLNLLIPSVFFFSLCEYLNIPLNIAQYLLFSLLLTFIFSSFYIFIDFILKDRYTSIKFITSILFSLNPFIFINLPFIQVLLVYGVMPLIFYLTALYFKYNQFKYLLFISLLTIPLSYAAVNPPIYSIFIITIIVAFIVNYIVYTNNKFIFYLKGFVLLFSLIFLLNVFWLISFINVSSELSGVNISKGWFWTSSLSNFLNIFRMLGIWAFDKGAFGSLYFPWHHYYEQAIIIVFSLLLFSSSIVVYFHKSFFDKKLLKFTYLTSIMLIVSLFLTKGVNQPFGLVFEFLFDNIPGFFLYREPWSKWMILVIFSFVTLLALSLTGIVHLKQSKKYLKYTILSVVCIGVGLISYPFFSGQLIIHDRGDYPGNDVIIPDYMYQSSSYINNKKLDSRLLVLPEYPFYLAHFFWPKDGYYGITADFYFWNQSLINFNSGNPGYISSRLSVKAQELFYTNYLNNNINIEAVQKLMGMLNVRGVIHRKDLDWTQLGTNNVGEPKKISEWLKTHNIATLEKNFGKINIDQMQTDQYFKKIISKYGYLRNEPALALYKVNDKYFLPHLYVPDSLIISNNSIEQLLNTIAQYNDSLKPLIIFKENNEITNDELSKLQISKMKPPVLEYKKINSTKYRVIIHNAHENFPLIFSETFNKNWKAYLVNSIQNTVTINNEFNVNNYHISHENQKDQANELQIKNFIKNGWISNIGKDFISKKFQDTIQNNNLENGSVIETWFRSPLESNHHLANGFANFWSIDLEKIKESGTYIQNPDGSIDFELVLEFWPQRIFYLGLLISLITLLSISVYLLTSLKFKK